MKFKKVLSLAASCAIAAGSVLTVPAGEGVVSAEESRKTDLKWYDEIITLVQDDVAGNGQHAQWYYMTDDSAFRTDGLNVTYNQDIVTDECDLSFREGDSPSKYYNGKTFEYDVPLDINFGGKSINSSVIAQIGKKSDANLDHLIDVRDAAIIARDVRTHIIFNKTDMSDFARFLVTGNRQDNVYTLKTNDATDIAKDLADRALKNSSGKRIERTNGSSGYSVSLSNAKGRPGETIALQMVVSAGNSFEALDAVVAYDGVDAKKVSASKSLYCVTASGDGKMAVVTYGDDKVKNGAISTISVTIPKDAEPGKDLEIYFSDINTFSVLGEDGSKDISDSVNVKGAKITVLKPLTTTPAVTTQAVTTTTTTTTATSAAPVTSEPKSSTTFISGFGHTTTAAETVTSVSETTVTSISGVKITTTAKTTASTTQTTTTPAETITIKVYQQGDANMDGKVDIRDAAYIAMVLTRKNPLTLDIVIADFNHDGMVNIRDAAAIAKYLCNKGK